MEDRHDVVVVGGGVAGGALGFVLAEAGMDVMVLEASEQFSDRVRGESMQPWGVREAHELGVSAVLHGAGAHTSPLWKRYSEAGGQPRDIPVGALIPGVGGTMNLHHPVACQALLDAAAIAGAHVRRGVHDVHVAAGPRPTVRFAVNGRVQTTAASLVVGADGRASVVRRDAGIALHRQAAMGVVAGLLLQDVEAPDDHDVLAEHDHGLFLMFHQGHGRARAYHVVGLDQRTRYSGPRGTARFLDDAAGAPISWAPRLASARVAGPCGAVLGTDTWTERPFADGVVLVGDAAGHNDPTAGCGLSIALRDVRVARDLILAGARRAEEFASYGDERMERMTRLRLIADLVNVASVEVAPNRRARRELFAAAMEAMDPQIFGLMLGMFVGPEAVPAHIVNSSVLDRLRAA